MAIVVSPNLIKLPNLYMSFDSRSSNVHKPWTARALVPDVISHKGNQEVWGTARRCAESANDKSRGMPSHNFKRRTNMPHPAVCNIHTYNLWSDLAVNQSYNCGSWTSHQGTFCLFRSYDLKGLKGRFTKVYADPIQITKTQVLSWFDKLSDGDVLPSW